MTQNNQNVLNNMFAPLQSMNLNLGNPKKCEKHQKPLSFYNKYKPQKDPICFDCLTEEAKELNPPNLYLPYSNLEQDFYFQKNSLMQIIEQANNMKKYERHISNFQQLLTRYFSQFIAKFIKEKIFLNVSKNEKLYDILENSNIFSTSSSQEIMNLLNKFESEKFILENKCADVFCQINKLQQIFIKNHKKIENGFRDLLFKCFEEKDENNNLNSYQKDKEIKNEGYYYKTQSNKKNPDIMNCVNMENEYYSQSNISAPCSSKNRNIEFMFSPQMNIKSPQNENIKQFSPSDKINNNINTNSTNPSNININMEKERVFEESPKPKHDESIKDPKKESFPSKSTLSPKKNSPEAPKKKDNDNIIYQDHKDKINSLIEKDKNKKLNQSFYQQPKKSNMKKKSKMNRSFHGYNKPKFGHKKNVEYKQYNQFIQKKCSICNAIFTGLENNTRDDKICQNCRNTIDEVDERKNKYRNKRDLSFKREDSDFHKYGHHQKNYISQKKKIFHTSVSSSNFWNKGKNNFIKTKKDSSFNSFHFSQKKHPHNSHNNSNFISRQINKRMNSPKPFRRPNNFRLKLNPKFRNNKEHHQGKNKTKDNFGIKKYNEKNLNDDFEVELNSVEESKNNESEDESEERKEKSFSKTTNDFFRNNFEEDKSDNDNNFDDFDNDDNKNDIAEENEEIKENENGLEDEDNDNNDLDIDF